MVSTYLKDCTSNIFTTIVTASRGPIINITSGTTTRVTIGGTAGTSTNLNIKTIATIGDTEGI